MSTSEGHGPTAESVRRVYADALMGDGSVVSLGEAWSGALAEFDAWLASERARIWDECDAAIVAHVERKGTSVDGWPVNPYRKGDSAWVTVTSWRDCWKKTQTT